jgi:hypothetical protein
MCLDRGNARCPCGKRNSCQKEEQADEYALPVSVIHFLWHDPEGVYACRQLYNFLISPGNTSAFVFDMMALDFLQKC